ncbi:DUF167 domain-containing protein [Candidatus Micrarchaeota archaeon]|nr:DUF167 domain-containing protein [Candidatus Micrarchaeota archaeon]
MKIEVRVTPNSKKVRILREEGYLKINLKSPAQNNRANRELLDLLSDFFGASVILLSGHLSKRKKLEVAIQEDVFLARLSSLEVQ